MPIKISNENLRFLRTRYRKNEQINNHTENAMMLINRFGSVSEKIIAAKKYKAFVKRGYITKTDSDWYYNHGHKRYNLVTDSTVKTPVNSIPRHSRTTRTRTRRRT